MEWGYPHNFLWLWALPFAWGVFYFSSFRKKNQMRQFGEIPLVQRLIASFDARKRLIKRILILVSILLLVLALCQPHFRQREITVERKGVEVMIVVDVSRSMLAKDIAPTRLEKSRLELSGLVDKLKQDRLGIVAFAGEAFIQCPLTLDKSAVKLFLSTLSPSLIPTRGTSIGSAILVASQAFSQKDKEAKAIILLTDGEDHESNPLEAAKKAKEMNIRIFTIGIGTADGSTLASEDFPDSFKKDRQGRIVLSKLDEPLLRQIARETGGTYTRASRGELELDTIANEIRQMNQKGFQNDKIIEYEENFQVVVGLALILLFVEMILSERKKT